MANTRSSLAFRALAQQVVAGCEKIHTDLKADSKNAENQTIIKMGQKLEQLSAAVKRIGYFEESERRRNPFDLKKQTKESYSLAEAKAAVVRLHDSRDTVKQKYAAEIARINAELNPPEPSIFDFMAGFAAQFADEGGFLGDKHKPKAVRAAPQTNKKNKETLEAELKAVTVKMEDEQKAFVIKAERECAASLDVINQRIKLQRQLFLTGISQRMMFDSLGVYAAFMELRDVLLEDYFAVGIETLREYINKFPQQMTELFRPLWCPVVGNKTAMQAYELYKTFDEATQKIVLAGDAKNMEKVIPKTNEPVASLTDLRTKLVDIPPALKANLQRDLVSWMYGRAAVDFVPVQAIAAAQTAAALRPSA